MSKELIERLRWLANMSAYSDYKEAADRIEELERERDDALNSMRVALEVQHIREDERDSLLAHIAQLQEAIEKCKKHAAHPETIYYTTKDALSATPTQSLARLRNQVLDTCARLCDNDWRTEHIAKMIRAMKEQE